jgi:hypothetical protein
MRHVLVSLLAFVGTLTVVACSSSDDKKDTGTSGTIAPLGDGGKSGDDDDDAKTADCTGVKSLDCAKQTAHAKGAACTKFDEKQWTDDCEAQNCGTPQACATELKAFGDCLLEQPPVCDAAGGVDTQVPAACKDKDAALFDCTVENSR